MNLGNKTLNNLTSKDEKISQKAAFEIVQNSDREAFLALVEKSDYLFDFIKEKISKKLANAVNQENIMNLFNFLDIYSEDYENFILGSFKKFFNENIERALFDCLINGSNSAKTYALAFFSYMKNEAIQEHARKFLKSDFEPLKSASIRALARLSMKLEYENEIKILSSNSDEIEKIEAVDFLITYGDKGAFEDIFKYFLKSGKNEIIASNMLCLKSFEELINENKEFEILEILSSILKSYPDEVSYFEIETSFTEPLLEFLTEADNNLAPLLLYYLIQKLTMVLEDSAYSLDLSPKEKEGAGELLLKLKSAVSFYDKNEVIKTALTSNNNTEILMALELADSNEFLEDIKKLCEKSFEDEIIASSILILKNFNVDKDFILSNIEKIKNEAIKAEILAGVG